MKNFIKKLVSVLLVFTLFSSTFLPTFWFESNQNNIIQNSWVKEIIKTKEDLERKYFIKEKIQTPYG